MKAVILAAGRGSRLGSKGKEQPKSMIKIGEKSIIHNQIQTCLDYGINDFVVVVGYQMETLKAHILELLRPDQITFVENPIYASTNTLYSLWLCRELFTDDFIYFNADIFFGGKMLDLFSSSQTSEFILEEKKCGAEEVKLVVDDKLEISFIGKQIEPEKCAGEFIGIAKFSRYDLKLLESRLTECVQKDLGNNYFEYAVNLMLTDTTLKAVPSQDLPCIEIDFPEDLEKAKTIIYDRVKSLENE